MLIRMFVLEYFYCITLKQLVNYNWQSEINENIKMFCDIIFMPIKHISPH